MGGDRGWIFYRVKTSHYSFFSPYFSLCLMTPSHRANILFAEMPEITVKGNFEAIFYLST